MRSSPPRLVGRYLRRDWHHRLAVGHCAQGGWRGWRNCPTHHSHPTPFLPCSVGPSLHPKLDRPNFGCAHQAAALENSLPGCAARHVCDYRCLSLTGCTTRASAAVLRSEDRIWTARLRRAEWIHWPASAFLCLETLSGSVHMTQSSWKRRPREVESWALHDDSEPSACILKRRAARSSLEP